LPRAAERPEVLTEDVIRLWSVAAHGVGVIDPMVLIVAVRWTDPKGLTADDEETGRDGRCSTADRSDGGSALKMSGCLWTLLGGSLLGGLTNSAFGGRGASCSASSLRSA
jgi:hypothetical protein